MATAVGFQLVTTMRMTIFPLGLFAFLLTTTGCITPAARIIVPSEVLRGANGDGNIPRGRYVVRMTNGEQDWEMQLPEIATAYEVRIPLHGQQVGAVEQSPVTAADKEILAEREAEARMRGDGESPAGEEEGAGKGRDGSDAGEGKKKSDRENTRDGDGKKTGRTAEAAREAPRASYLLTLAKVKELYRTRHYEVALVELVALERQYPDDERILSMKGSLYEKLGKRELARAAWQAVLALNPYNLQVAEALQHLDK